MSARSQDATHKNFKELHPDYSQPTVWKYFPGRVAVALLGEGIIRRAGWTETLSWKGIDNLTGASDLFCKLFWCANAQETGTSGAEGIIPDAAAALKTAQDTAAKVAESVTQNGSTTPSSAGTLSSYFPQKLWDQVTGFVGTNWQSVCTYADENKNWIGLVAGFATTAATVNYLSSGKIKNPYLRNLLSLGIGGAVVWTVSNYAVGHEVSLNALGDIGSRMVVSHALLKYVVAPVAQTALSYIHKGVNCFRWNMSFTPPRPGKATA